MAMLPDASLLEWSLAARAFGKRCSGSLATVTINGRTDPTPPKLQPAKRTLFSRRQWIRGGAKLSFNGLNLAALSQAARGSHRFDAMRKS